MNSNGHSQAIHGRLLNAGGEIIAEGPCHVDDRKGQATMEPARTPGVIQKERGRLMLQLETGRSLPVSDKAIIFRVKVNGRGAASRRLYRLRLLRDDEVLPEGRTAGDLSLDMGTHDAGAAGAGQGQPALLSEETPAAR